MDNPARESRITETLEENYMPYAMSVIVSRAIPEIDGFKPAHRKLLYTMYTMGLLKGGRTKSANVVGQTMRLNPHGDQTIYETMVRLTEGHEALLHPFVDSKGNFGKQYSRDMAYAAARYTEVKLAPIAAEVFRDTDKNTVEFVDNYDSTMKEPTLLPCAFPNILVNPNQGIAVGMASNIASFNLREVCLAAKALMKDDKVRVSDYITGPDFSTGAYLIRDEEAFEKIYETGRGSVRLRAKYSYDKKNNLIEITEIPYTTSTEAIIDKLAEMIKGGKLREVSDVRDETDKTGLKLAIDLKRGTDPEKLMERLYKQTPLEDVFGCNFNVLIDGEPFVLGVRDILKHWINFRVGCTRRRLVFDAEKKEARLHLLLGLKEILLDIDKAIAIVRNTPEDSMVVPNLMEGFGIDRIQAEYVAEIKLRNLNRDYILKRIEEVDSLTKEVADLRAASESTRRIKKIIADELDEIVKKYGVDRKTIIIDPPEISDEPIVTEIPDYNVKVFMTRDNYFKKITLVSLRSGGEQKLKEGDSILVEADASNKMDMLFFSDRQNVYKMRLSDIRDTKASSMGDFLPNLLGVEEGERIIYAIPSNNYTGFMLFAFKNGKIAKIDMKSYETKTNRRRLTGGYCGTFELANALFIPEDCELAAFSDNGKCVVFNTGDILTKTSRTSQGVQVMTLRKKSLLQSVTTTDCLANPKPYRAKNLPSAGYYLKDEDAGRKQLGLFDE
ncbi:MAG: DNA topoisomerase (ATP-hydrolyzing) subunit A [Clostridia bacterium]|nr:DNA topoisomerase (ATP-hydrolyzing) subunit A [Clostridia bacterium]